MTEFEDRPPAEHTTRDPWPEGFDVPDVVAKLKGQAERSGWDVRVGYSRAFEKIGTGKVGGKGTARWVRMHYIGVQVRQPEGAYLMNRVIYSAPADVKRLTWTVNSVQVQSEPSGILAFNRLIKAGPL